MPRMTKKGQVTIPKRIREKIGIGPGSEVEFAIESGKCVLKKKFSEFPFDRWTGYLKKKKSTKQIIDKLRGKTE